MHTFDTFILKIHDGSSAKPRGYIQHVATSEKKYFDGFPEMTRFINEHLVPLSDAPAGDVVEDQNETTKSFYKGGDVDR